MTENEITASWSHATSWIIYALKKFPEWENPQVFPFFISALYFAQLFPNFKKIIRNKETWPTQTLQKTQLVKQALNSEWYLLEVSFSTNQLLEHKQSDMFARYCDAVRNGLGTQIIANNSLIRWATGVSTGGTRLLCATLLSVVRKNTKMSPSIPFIRYLTPIFWN